MVRAGAPLYANSFPDQAFSRHKKAGSPRLTPIWPTHQQGAASKYQFRLENLSTVYQCKLCTTKMNTKLAKLALSVENVLMVRVTIFILKARKFNDLEIT